MKVVINFAISADGKIGLSTGGASKFTSRHDLERLWEIRGKNVDAIMVGRKTLEADQMTMTIPAELNPEKQPLRIIVSRTGGFNFSHPIFQKPGGDLHLLSTESSIIAPSAEVTAHQMSLLAFLDYCEKELGVETLLCEGGGELVRSLAELQVITEINLTLAGHTLLGGATAPVILGTLSEHLPKTQRFRLTHFEQTPEAELFLTYQA